ncbi:hypothetical protein NIES4073_31720 [Kalymmatonema gypsitolerans NIES-4073]|nr:hypothetical protein NIES4073_31720 [Scytonema sp. NIES-4073]
MLTVRLDEETERQLADILAHEKTDKSELIRRLIAERWLNLQAGKTLVDRRGGHPQHLLQDAPPDLSERANRKKAMLPWSRALRIRTLVPSWLLTEKEKDTSPQLMVWRRKNAEQLYSSPWIYPWGLHF